MNSITGSSKWCNLIITVTKSFFWMMGSDNSWTIIDLLENPNVRAFVSWKNLENRRLACWFCKAKGDVIITMDADLQDSQRKFRFMIWLLTEIRFGFGWKRETLRFCCGKKLPSKLFNWAARKHLVWNWMISIVAWKPTKILS
jgi:glycosyltransferase involved in cell wall biosynthesis